MMKENLRLEKEVENTKQQAAASIRKAQTEANRQIIQAQEKADEEIRKMVEEVERANAERDYQISLNQNLLRINKEKSNAERKLRPKKSIPDMWLFLLRRRKYVIKPERECSHWWYGKPFCRVRIALIFRKNKHVLKSIMSF